ncbi:hypothetical protein FHS83_002323 [Rhizomicrobium palustre]|uniref:Uncharacterized protein n=1 Tax=Rhizomicrobium palustre TaxID=189966 RepID=A0A846N0J1_9PROT|nr:hypothetical protein [Rhizomicrobium palustre]NIK89005.1 hypothetical protein [Rhizomicrobium palustre]
MRLRAQITIDISAEDFVEAAEHQNKLARFVESLKSEYPNAEMIIRERRERRPDSGNVVSGPQRLRPVGVRQTKVG